MNIIIPYCHKDAHLALALVKWIAWLGEQRPQTKQAQALFVTTAAGAEHSASMEMMNVASQFFATTHSALCASSVDKWPEAPNAMFSRGLAEATQLWPDGKFLWLEPDAVPLAPMWYESLKAASEKACFVGAKVSTAVPHMSGVAIYCSTWNKLAPRLGTATSVPFDLWSAPEVIPIAHWTNLIQHVPDGFPRAIRSDALLYHPVYPGFSLTVGRETYEVRVESIPEKFYKCQNATRAVSAGGFQFKFQVYAVYGNLPAGIFSTTVEAEQIALQSAVSDPRSGVSEITIEDHARLKKKLAVRRAGNRSLESGFLAPLTDTKGNRIVAQKEGRKLSVSGKVEILPREPEPAREAVKPVADVVSLGKVAPAEPGPTNPKPKKNR